MQKRRIFASGLVLKF